MEVVREMGSARLESSRQRSGGDVRVAAREGVFVVVVDGDGDRFCTRPEGEWTGGSSISCCVTVGPVCRVFWAW